MHTGLQWKGRRHATFPTISPRTLSEARGCRSAPSGALYAGYGSLCLAGATSPVDNRASINPVPYHPRQPVGRTGSAGDSKFERAVYVPSPSVAVRYPAQYERIILGLGEILAWSETYQLVICYER